MLLKQIILIHKNKFVIQVMETLCQSADILIYSMEDANDFAYLLDDLKPDILLVDEGILKDELLSFNRNLEQAENKDYKIIVLGDNNYGINGEIFSDGINPETILNELAALIA